MFGWSKKERAENKAAMDAVQAEYEIYKASMYQTQTLQISGHFVKIFVCEISINARGRLGLILCSNYKHSARIVHEINKDGTVSKKQAYWSKQTWKRCEPRKYAVVKCIYGPPLIPVEILQMDSEYRPEMTFDEWRFHYGK